MNMHYLTYHEDINRTFWKCKKAIEIGDVEEFNRLINQDIYQIFFAQREYLKGIHKIVIETAQKHRIDNTREGKNLINSIELSTRKINKLLCNWPDNPEKLIEIFNRIYNNPQEVNSEGGN